MLHVPRLRPEHRLQLAPLPPNGATQRATGSRFARRTACRVLQGGHARPRGSPSGGSSSAGPPTRRSRTPVGIRERLLDGSERGGVLHGEGRRIDYATARGEPAGDGALLLRLDREDEHALGNPRLLALARLRPRADPLRGRPLGLARLRSGQPAPLDRRHRILGRRLLDRARAPGVVTYRDEDVYLTVPIEITKEV